MDGNDAQALIFARNAFYRRLHFLVLAALALCLVVIIILCSILVHILRYPTAPLYFPTDIVGRMIHDIPVDRPNMSRDEVVAWTIESVENSFSYDYINFRSQLQNAQKYYTEYGWRTYMDSLKASNNLVALDKRRMVFIAKVIDKPKLVAEGILGGAYAWKFDMKVLMTYLLPPYDNKSSFTNPLVVTVTLQRLPILQSYKGLGILQVIANIAVAGEPQSTVTTAAPPPS